MEVNTIESNRELKPWLFQPGNKSQPKAGYQKYADRVTLIEEELSPEQLLELVANPKLLNKRSIRDVQIIKRLARTLADVTAVTCSDVRQELEAHLDRIEGKAAQSITHTGTITHTQLTPEEQAETHEMLMRYQSKHKEIIDVTAA